MKKLYYLIVLTLILGLVLTGCLLSNVGQVPTSEQSGVSSIAKDSIDPDLICFDFEDLAVGQDVTFPGIIWDYLKIYSSIGDLTLEVIKVNPDTSMAEKVAYNTITGTNNGCLSGSKGFGPVNPDDYSGPGGTHARPLDTNNIVFEFAQGVTVSTFSIDIFDYGDMVHKTGDYYSHFVVTLTAYDANDVLVDDYEYEITDGGQGITKYDACSTSGLGIHYLNVTGFGISKVEMAFTESIDVGIGFDNICFTPEENVCTTNLMAGQTEYVGNVEVKYTLGDELITVTYNTNEPWLMEEIHFHASFDSPESWGKPVVNKAGNPAPGHFLVVDEDLGGSNSESFTIPLSEIDGGVCGAFFAAHAKVYKLSDVIDDEFIVSGSDTSNVDVFDVDPFANPLAIPTSSGISKIVDFAAWSGPVDLIEFPLARWIIEYYDSLPPWELLSWDPTIESWRRFTRNFDIPSNAASNAVYISGMLKITADNAEQILLNSNIVGSNGDWTTIISYSLNSGELIAGDNKLDIIVHNYSAGSSSVNPTGLIYKLEYQYQLKTEETAWGEGADFSGKNWAMYLGCPDLIPCPF